jgi:hypothetical protein
VVDTSGHNCGASNSLAVVGGFAGISYIDSTTQSLMFAGAVDSYGAAWAPPIPLDTVHSDSTLTSLAAVNGDPAISYQDGNSQLKFVRAQNPAGSVWAPPVVVDSTPSSGAYSSLAVVNGKPAIAFQRGTYGVYYARATDSNGQAWGAPVQVDWNGRFPALAAVAGQPLIAWFGEVNAATLKSSLRFSRPEDSNGSSWSGGGTVDDAVSANGPAVFRVVGGIAVLGYYDIIAGQLKFARATDTTGLEWQTPLVLDQGGTPTGTLSLTAVDGRTGISYCDNMQGGLRYIQMD